MTQITVNLDEATAFLREILAMNKTQLIQAANFKYVNGKIKKADVMAYILEKHFNANAIDPTVAIAKARPDPYGKGKGKTIPFYKRVNHNEALQQN